MKPYGLDQQEHTGDAHCGGIGCCGCKYKKVRGLQLPKVNIRRSRKKARREGKAQTRED